jgi:hypothetical protein
MHAHYTRLGVCGLILLAGLGFLSACGIKPGSVSAPGSVDPDRFPRTYPNPADSTIPPRN